MVTFSYGFTVFQTRDSDETAQLTVDEEPGEELHGIMIHISKPPKMEEHEPLNLKLYVKNHKLELKPIAQNVFRVNRSTH